MLGASVGAAVLFEPRPAFVFFFPAALLFLLERASFSRAFFIGWAAGFGCNAVALYWVVGLLEVFAGFPTALSVLVACLLFVAQGLVLGVAVGISHGATQAGAARWVSLPCAIVIAFSFSPSLFPWNLSSATIGWLEWAQIAELGGTPLLDFLAMLSGSALYEALSKKRKFVAFVGACALFGPALFGSIRLSQIEGLRADASTISIGVVQPNIGIWDKHDRTQHADHLLLLQEMSVDLEQNGAQLVVWPETAYPHPFPRGVDHDLNGRYAVRHNGVQGPLLVGALTRQSACDRWNSALAIDRQGMIQGVVDKVELIPFGESIPLWELLPPLQNMFPCPGLKRGRGKRSVRVAKAHIGILNCYEDVLAHQALEVAQQQPELLINLTNDAWFGDTREPHLHQLAARFRSIETRRDLVRAVNTGVSAHISATGVSVIETETWVQSHFIAQVRKLSIQTFWVRFGDLVTPLAFIWLSLWAGWGFNRHRGPK